MSIDIVKKALELSSFDSDEDTGNLPAVKVANTNKRKKRKAQKAVVSTISKKSRVKSIIEEKLEAPKDDYLLRNLRYLKYSEKTKFDPEKMKNIMESFDKEKRERQYWKQHQEKSNEQRRKRLNKPCVFTDEDFKRWAETLHPNLKKVALSLKR